MSTRSFCSCEGKNRSRILLVCRARDARGVLVCVMAMVFLRRDDCSRGLSCLLVSAHHRRLVHGHALALSGVNQGDVDYHARIYADYTSPLLVQCIIRYLGFVPAQFSHPRTVG